MKPLFLLLAALVGSCMGPDGSAAPLRAHTLDLPPGCRPEGPAVRRQCTVPADGYGRVITVWQNAQRFDQAFDDPQAKRAALARDPASFWAATLRTSEENGRAALQPDYAIRHADMRAFPPPAGAEACIWFEIDATEVATGRNGESRGIRCALYDPASDVTEEFGIDFIGFPPLGAPPDPTLAADAERAARSLRFAPPGAAGE
ncbi:MAG: hypothetical protein U1E34_02205 [Amaricoccus sp.]